MLNIRIPKTILSLRIRLLFASCCLLLLGLTDIRAQAPVANFSATPTAGCGPLTVRFTDQSTNGPLFWSWDFGDGQTSNLQNPSAVYGTPGTYDVTLIVKNRSGSNAIRKTGYITVYPFPTVQFTSNLTTACSPAQVQFTDQSVAGQGNITAWSWGLGDGTTSNVQNPAHTYTQTGYYTISLQVTNSGGCSNNAAVTRYLRVVSGIQPNFAWNQTSASCSAPFIVNFLNQTAGPGNLTFNWSLGSGAVPANSTDTNPTNVTYPASGNYTVNLQVNSDLGCSASLQQTLSFNGNSATFNGPATACVNDPVVFSNTSSPLPPANNWDFGDGTGSDSSSATKTWTAIGSYAVKLVNHYATCADSLIKTVQVINPPTVAFTANAFGSCKAPFTVQFTDGSTGETAGSTTWQWDFGDGQTSQQQNPSHTYNATGNFTVKLTVTTAGGCSNTLTKNNYINITTPVVAITNANTLGACIASAGANSTVNPVAIINSPSGVASYNWQAPSSTQGSSTSASPSFTYPTAGSYTISLSITTPDGCTSPTATSTVAIGTPTPAAFTMNPNPVCGRNTVTFTATSIPADHFSWNFGDGTSTPIDTAHTVTHAYNKISPPSLPVTLTVINAGCPTAITQNITIDPPIPNFGFQMVGCPYTVGFLDSSLTDGSPTMTYQWDFGDGSPVVTTTGPAPLPPALATTHTYAAGGTYTVTLTLTDGATCGPTIWTRTITLAAVTPSFTAPATACENQNFTLTSTSTVTNPPGLSFIRSYTWQIGGKTVGSGPGLTVSMPTIGAYPIILTDTDVNGCYYSTPASTIQITGPTAQFAVLPNGGGCLNSPITFTDQSTPYPGNPIVGWSFNFGDGNSQNFFSPPLTHAYADTGTYLVRMIVTDNNHCQAASIGKVLVATPIAKFAVPDSFYCANEPLAFLDSSQGYGITELWNFGDGSANSPTGVHTYANNGNTYPVTLTVTDQNGCTSTASANVHIQNPIAAFNIYDTTSICAPLQTLFAAHGQYYDSLYWNFGDGTTSTLDSTYHFYNAPDTFTAKLYVEGPGGCFDSASRRVLVLNPVTTTTFNYSPLKACDSVDVQFSITPPGYTRFILTFGDYTADSSQNLAPLHMYRNPNSYRPFLTIVDSTGCVAVLNGTNIVNVLGSTPFFAVDKHGFCDSSVVNFTDYSLSNDGFFSESYNFGDGSPLQTLSPGTGSFNVANFYNKPGVWLPTLSIVTNSGCKESYTDTITVHQTPHPVITVTSAYCAGPVSFEGSLTGPVLPTDTVNWNWNFGNGQTSNQEDPTANLPAGPYNVTLTTSIPFGCSDTASSMATIYPVPAIKGPAEITTPVGTPVTIPFTYSGDSIVSYTWAPATNLDCSTCPNPLANVVFATEYTVTVMDTHNCTATDSILIKTICNSGNYWFPNTFSPNGDGVNDYFYPRGTSLYNVQSLTIFNRWGQMVFQRRDFPANAQNMGWDGTFNGRPAATDVYVYVAEVICENAQTVVLSGNVTLLR